MYGEEVGKQRIAASTANEDFLLMHFQSLSVAPPQHNVSFFSKAYFIRVRKINRFAILIYIGISIKIHNLICIKQA